MSTNFSRRTFIDRCGRVTAAGMALGALGKSSMWAVEPLKRKGSPRLLLSLAAYSFRDYFDQAKRKPNQAERKRIDLFDFVDYCADHRCQGTELTSYYFPESVGPEYLLKLKRHAFLRGVAVSGTAVGNTFTDPKGEKRNKEIALTKRWIDYAQILGAPHIRVFAGTANNLSKEEAKRLCIEALEECGEYAANKGVFLGIENHGGIVSEPDDLLEIVRAVKSPAIGINLDTGNFRTDDPYADLARCAPYAVNVQFKVEVQPRGKSKQKADLSRVVDLLKRANYQGYVALEYEAAEDPWKVIPELLQEMAKQFHTWTLPA
jgi:sugar phosphate isomerase/epimerase